MHKSKEYTVCRQISDFLRYQYPNVIWRFDMSGLNLSKAQAGMNKAIQKLRGYPDLFIIEPRNGYHGLFLEIKQEGTRLTKMNGDPVSEHIYEQTECMSMLEEKGFKAEFACGFDHAIDLIRSYLG